ncbi:tetratricopeptide repeat-containing diguanylate cyclase [Paraglaciecola sp. 20A4]|uniref:tetratricopeptide repeat-containing diguanylate cyclase n=1 Tax=Paraglaciecola sp. 20A4 TaxID=2687288 RepID=UPI001F0D315D|nr:tetratricopeptide repeat-containing diguanylate cyclase [Paraglaciecola sp. 20A4]
MAKIVWFCFLLIIGTIHSVIAAEAVVSKFSDQYQSLTLKLTLEPKNVLSDLLNNPPSEGTGNTAKAEYYAILSDTHYALTHPKDAIDSARKGLSYIKKDSEPWLYHNLRLIEATALEMAGKPIEGLKIVNDAIQWAKTNGDEDTYLLGLYARGSLFITLNEYSASAESFLKAYARTTHESGKISKANIAGMLGVMYEKRGDYLLAIQYYAEAAAHARKNNEPLNLSIALFGLGSANFHAGNLAIAQAQLSESADIADALGDEQGVGYALQQMGQISIEQQDYKLAEQRLGKAAAIFARTENIPMDFQVARSLFIVALATADYAKAQTYRDSAKAYLDQQTMPVDTIEFATLEGRLAAALGDFPQAYGHVSRGIELSKLYYESRNKEDIHRVREIFNVRESEQANRLLEHQNRIQRLALEAQEQRNMYLWSFSGIALLVCCLLGVMVYRVKAQSRALSTLAITDHLTGLYNRRHIIEQLDRQVSAAQRYHYDLCVAIIDLDFFKKINDSYGHAVGDSVLVAFSQVCSDNLRNTDLIGRIGGEEFLVVLPHTSLQDGYSTLDGLRRKMVKVSQIVGIKEFTVSASIGLTINAKDLDSMQLMANADTALYLAKSQGRDQVVVHPTDSSISS